MKRSWAWSPAVGILLGMLAPLWASADCGTNKVVVDGECDKDRQIACAGLHRALGFLARYGVALDRPVKILFTVHFEGVSFSKEAIRSIDVPLSGYYNASSGCVVVLSSSSPAEAKPLAFGHFPMTDEMLTSAVAHEVVHHVHYCLCKSRGEVMDRPASEYLAYVVQIETMADTEKAKVLQLWPDSVLPSRCAVNLFLWGHNPPRFGIMAYRFHRLDPDLFRDILWGNYTSPDPVFPVR